MHPATPGPSAALTAAVIGCGDVSSVHFAAITANPGVELIAVCDVDPGRLNDAVATHSSRGYSDYLQLLDVESPDVVHICTPHHLHADMAVACLQRNVNVLLEKPLATTVSDGRRLIEASDRSDAQIGVCFQNRYNATARSLRAVLDAHAYGPVLGARASVTWHRDEEYYRRRDWRGRWDTAGGGVLINQAIHTLDLLLWCLGDVRDVRGRTSTLFLTDVIEVDDTATIQLTHRSGARSVFYATNGYVENAPITIEIRTERAILRLDSDLTLIGPAGHRTIIAEQHRIPGTNSHWGVSHGPLIDDFYRHARSGEPFWIDAREASKTLDIISAVYDQSHHRPAGTAADHHINDRSSAG